MKNMFLIGGLTLALALGATACKKAEAPAADATLQVKTFPITGEVVKFQAEGKVVILKHEKIEGLMDAMTMGFELADPKLGSGLKVGDKVKGTLEQSPDSYVITSLAKQ